MTVSMLTKSEEILKLARAVGAVDRLSLTWSAADQAAFDALIERCSARAGHE